MSCYSVPDKLMYLHIPKTGGVTIRFALAKIVGAGMRDFDALDEAHRTERDPGIANHFPIWRVQRLLQETGQEEAIPLVDLRSFMTVRNPWARMVSLYAHRFSKRLMHYEGKPRNTEAEIAVIEQGFTTWLLRTPSPGDHILTRTPQADWGKDKDGNFVVDRVLFLENLKEDWECLCLDWDLLHVLTGKHNVGNGQAKNYQTCYDDETREHVAKYFSEDIKRWRYEF